MTVYRQADVDVRGGPLRVGIWDSDDISGDAEPDTTVLAVHGITATHVAWAPVAQRLTVGATGTRVIGVDLRGRGRSSSLPGPWGMDSHAADVAEVLERLGCTRALVLGHSMGGFVAVVFGARYPSSVAALVLVDGGLPLMSPDPPPVANISPAQALRVTLGPAAERLSMTFRSVGEYREFWRAHPAFGPNWSDAVERYVDYDLIGEPPVLRSSVSYEALVADSAELSDPEVIISAWQAVNVETLFLRAPLGLLAQPPGLYPPSQLKSWALAHPNLTWIEVPNVNHYTITLGAAGADAVAFAVLTVAGRLGRMTSAESAST
ncbi:MAG: alpha/beta fold hydrolase [Solirubrobacteraceae bacterium]